MKIDNDNTLPGIYKNNPNKRHQTNINESDEFRSSRNSRPSSSFRNTKIFRLSTDKSSIDHENFDKILKENNSPENIKNKNYRYQNNNLMNDYAHDHQEKLMKIKLSKDNNNNGNYLFNINNNLMNDYDHDHHGKLMKIKLSKDSNNNGNYLFNKNNNLNLITSNNNDINLYRSRCKEYKQKIESLEKELYELKSTIDLLNVNLKKERIKSNKLQNEKEYINEEFNKLKKGFQREKSINKDLMEIIEEANKKFNDADLNNRRLRQRIQEYEKIEKKSNYDNDNSIIMNRSFFTMEKNELKYPRGEHYFKLIKDYNDINAKNENNNNKKQPIQLYFSLNNVIHQNNAFSFKISIVNNKDIENTTYLGSLENRIGNNIEFGTPFQIDYFFERKQVIIIEPVVNGEETGQLIEYPVSDLMRNTDSKLSKNIENIGTLQISCVKPSNQNKNLNNEISIFEFYIELNNNQIFGGKKKVYDVYFVIKRFRDGITKKDVYKSSERDYQLNKKYKTSSINLESNILCEDKDNLIYFELYVPSLNANDWIGTCSFSLNKLENILKEDKFLKIPIKNKRHGDIGTLEINYNKKEKITFDQFIKKGQINLDIAIDYTKSNGDPNNVDSLHHLKENERNDYEKAIKSCGDIIAYYDADNKYPVYGFGGIPEGSNEVSHCFNVNFNPYDENIEGIDNIIKYYRDSLKKVKLSYPTYFCPIIKKVIEDISFDKKDENHYHILMILTDGIIKDMEDTINAICDASKLPLSIVIIGIGNNSFTGMDILDGDEDPLRNSKGELRKRDIVQFVKFNTFKDKKKDCGTELADEVLKEIPRQIEEYYQFCGKLYT